MTKRSPAFRIFLHRREIKDFVALFSEASAPLRRAVCNALERAFTEGQASVSPPTRPALELVILPNADVARAAGFRTGRRHPQMQHISAWWPGCGLTSLHMIRPQRITIDSSVGRWGNAKERQEFQEAMTILRTGQQVWGAEAVWMEF